jgi:DNA repair exonuclease SbcCD ATPase subunit
MGENINSVSKRVADVKAKRERAKKRLEQYNEEIKRLEKQEAEEARKYRTHMLIVCGAELAALYEKNLLEKDEIHAVVNFLREQQAAGVFTLRNTEEVTAEEPQEPTEEMNGSNEDIFGELFGF